MGIHLKKQRTALETKQAELEQSIAGLTEAHPRPISAVEINEGPQDREDIATDFLEMQQEQSLLVNQQALLTLVKRALQRLEDGTYGLCQECGQAIPERRLEVIPWAERDVPCEEALEAHYRSREEVYGEPQTF